MKEIKRWKRGLALLLCVGLLPGCGAAEQVADTEVQYVVEVYQEPGTESLAVNEPETEASPLLAEPPSEETVSEMLGSFLNWSAMSYMVVLGEEFREQDELTPKQMIPMAAHAAAISDARITKDDEVGCYVMTEEVLEEYEENLFGQTCELSQYTLDKEDQAAVDNRGINMRDNLGIASDGTIWVPMGDWGGIEPKFQIQEIARIEDTNQFQVKVNYYEYRWLDDPETSELGMSAEYTFEPSETSTYGYVITDMKYMEP